MTEFQAPVAPIEVKEEVAPIPEIPSESLESQISKLYGDEENLENLRLEIEQNPMS